MWHTVTGPQAKYTNISTEQNSCTWYKYFWPLTFSAFGFQLFPLKTLFFFSLKNHEVCRLFSHQVYPSVFSSTSGVSFRSTSFCFFLLLYLYSWHCLKMEHLFMFSTFSRLVFSFVSFFFFLLCIFSPQLALSLKKCCFNCS